MSHPLLSTQPQSLSLCLKLSNSILLVFFLSPVCAYLNINCIVCFPNYPNKARSPIWLFLIVPGILANIVVSFTSLQLLPSYAMLHILNL